MDVVYGVLAVAAVTAAVLASLVWLSIRARRRGIGDAVMGPADEIWHPAAHRVRVERQVQEERPAPRPAPGD